MKLFATVIVASFVLAACSTTTTDEPAELVLLTHDSFALSEGTLDAFTVETGIKVTVLEGGDGGSLVTQAVLSKDNPTGDVLYGVDNTLLTRALDLFVPYESPALSNVDPSLVTDARVTPIDFGDVCLNYEKSAFSEVAPPAGLDDLLQPAYANMLVVENPATSSPGLAFLLATIVEYGEDGWQDYWTDLLANGTVIAPDWETAYYTNFTGGGGTGSPIVVSYASSPPAGVIFAEEPTDEALTATVTNGCFRQVEYAGILKDSEAARKLVDFMLSKDFQEDIPLNMFVFPARTDAALPTEFVDYTEIPSNPLTMDPETIDANRDRWIDEWTQIAAP
ncbi:MAG: thiamine ABC transporter substrate-binding protein [Acidimicrobiia bacterium]|nr:thiamine ABC transporter substrate-binding protein [Acidimicrobiia bacterium]